MEYTTTDITALNVLLEAQSKSAVNDLFLIAFACRSEKASSVQLQAASEMLGGVAADKCQLVLDALKNVIMRSCYVSNLDANRVLKMLPEEISEQLAKLIAQIVVHHFPTWRQQLLQSQISGPKLLDVDWRVDIKSASDLLPRMAAPTCVVEMKVQELQRSKDELPSVKNVAFEMSKEEINTMIQVEVKRQEGSGGGGGFGAGVQEGEEGERTFDMCAGA